MSKRSKRGGHEKNNLVAYVDAAAMVNTWLALQRKPHNSPINIYVDYEVTFEVVRDYMQTKTNRF